MSAGEDRKLADGPRCECGASYDARKMHTMYDGNRGGHAISCPRRDYDDARLRRKHGGALWPTGGEL